METQTSFAGYGVSLQEKVDRAIALLREHEPKALELSPTGYHLGFSGGKDSCVILDLAKRSGVKFRPVYNQTTIDPPELVRFIKQHHPEVEWSRPKRNFFKALVESHGPPSRVVRWCCEEFKESSGDGLIKCLGVRAAESAGRKKRWSEVTKWRSELGGYVVSPIVFWEDSDVWEYIKQNHLPYCNLYDEGWTRLGCVGCPMAGQKRIHEFERWPRFQYLWQKFIIQYWESRKDKLNRVGLKHYASKFSSGQEMYDWWLSDDPYPKETEQECLGLYDE